MAAIGVLQHCAEAVISLGCAVSQAQRGDRFYDGCAAARSHRSSAATTGCQGPHKGISHSLVECQYAK